VEGHDITRGCLPRPSLCSWAGGCWRASAGGVWIRWAVPILALTNIAYSIGSIEILRSVTFALEPGERVGLVGRNGAGKSTLLRLVEGEIAADDGIRMLARSARVGMLRQDPVLEKTETLRGEAESAFAELHELHRRIDALYGDMAGEEGGNTGEKAMGRLAKLEREMEAKGGYAVGHRIDAILHGLGFSDADFSLPVSGLSGGQRARLALGKLLLAEPDVLLLDEPTNHLDTAGCEWLEQFLSERFKGAVVMVSHDRYMLDCVVDRIVEVEDGRLIDYPGSYSAFREMRAQRRLTQYRVHQKQQTKFKTEEKFIAKFKAGQRAKQARGRQTRLDRERAQTIERPAELDSFKMQFPPAPRPGDLVAVLRKGEVTFENEDGKKTLFKNLDLTISRGERWGVIGPNGVGKTTLINAMLEKIPLTNGSTRLGTNVCVGYYRQTLDEPDETPVFQFIQRAIRLENPELSLSEQAARDLAGAFLFSGKDQDKPMNEISGGERSRARLAALLASAKNLLVLDEPTNHLDIPAAERLEQTLKKSEDGGAFDGTLILVSHDRALIDALCDHLLVFDGGGGGGGEGGVDVYHGNYTQWRDHRALKAKERAAAEKDAARSAAKSAGKTEAQAATKDAGKSGGDGAGNGAAGNGAGGNGAGGNGEKNPFSWMGVEQLEERIGTATAQIGELDVALAKPETYADRDGFQRLLDRHEKLKGELEVLEEEWLRKSEG
jgi:ATP-binding cassette, subfamily F, member 3